MQYDKVPGGYEALTVYSQRQVDIVIDAINEHGWAHNSRTGRGHKPEYKVKAGERFGVPCWTFIVKRQYEVATVNGNGSIALTNRFKKGDRFRLVATTMFRRPVGMTGTIVDVYAGEVYVALDGEETDTTTRSKHGSPYYRTPMVGPWFIDPID